MNADELIKLIPPKVLKDLAVETKVDFQVKKLTGEALFKLILFSMLNSEKLSLRVMEEFLKSAKFKSFSKNKTVHAKYNSIRDRICAINAKYFENLFYIIFKIYNKHLHEEEALIKADSTYVSVAAKLLSDGMLNGTKLFGKKHVKYSVSLKGSLPCNIKVYTNQAFISEDLALAELIKTTTQTKKSIIVFDRGLQSRKVLDEFSSSDKLFIGRCNFNTRCKVIKEAKISSNSKQSTVTLLSDQTGYLFGKKETTKKMFRIIKGKIDKTNEPIGFVTNIFDQEAHTIAQLYKKRWEIEIFFKFLKQHLNLKHLVSRDSNGMKVMIYMTMILAILILVYKKLNQIKGFKIAKLKFEIDLENSIIKQIVILCGGNPFKAKHLWNSS